MYLQISNLRRKRKNIVVSSYSYFPFANGGTEIYTKALVDHLKAQGHNVLIFASGDKRKLAELSINYFEVNNTPNIEIFLYKHLEVDVLSVLIRNESLKEQYSNYNILWENSIANALDYVGWKEVDYLFMQGYSGVTGLSLLKALQSMNFFLKSFLWCHTPFICPKGTLLNEGAECTEIPESKICSICITKSKLKVGELTSCLITSSVGRLNFTDFFIFNSHKYLNLHFKTLKEVNQYITKWICFNPVFKNHLLKWGVDEGKILVEMHGIEVDTFNIRRDNNKLIFDNGRATIFLFNGRVEKAKGVQILAKAWCSLEEKSNLRRLVVVTDKPKSRLFGDLNKRHDVTFLPLMSPEQLSDLYNEVHVVLIPSQFVETGPLVFHEAIACGCSVITTPIGGNKYLGEHYKRSSTFFEIDNYLDLAKKISNFKYEFLVHPINSIKNHFLNVLPSDLT